MSGSETGGIGRREVAWRLFAAEFDDATLEYSDSDEERAPNYVITPTGARVNRVVVVGVLTEVESVSEDVLRARVVDPTGAFVVYAGQYQPDAASFLERASPPMYVAVTGKARTFSPEGSDRVFTSIRPESITEVDAETRDRWTVQAAAHTIDRIAAMAAALDREERADRLSAVLGEAGLAQGLAAGIPLAIDHYTTTPGYLAALRRAAIEALRVVTGDLEEVTPVDVSPADPGEVDGDLERPVGAVVASGAVDAIGSVRIGGETPARAGDRDEPAAAPAEPSSGTGREDDDPGAGAAPTPGEVDDSAAEEAAAAGTPAEPVRDDPADGDDGLYELDEDEREEIESEFGTEFSAGSEIDAPGEAGIEPEAGVGGEAPAEDPAAPSTDGDESDGGDDAPADAGEATDGTADVDLEEAVVAAMRDLDEGDGAGHDEVVAAVAEAHGVADAAVADAIQDALMSGKCYEPGDDRLKAI